MSVHAVKWAWSLSVGNPTRKLVLVALADHANADGECWPTMKRVAEFAECDPRTVQRHVGSLEKQGFVERVGRRPRADGTFGPWHYKLDMSSGRMCPEDNLSSGHREQCPPDTSVVVQRTLVSGRNHQENHQEESKAKPRARAAALPDGWQPKPSHAEKADELSVSVTAEAEAFTDYHLSKGSTFVDWDRAFHTWLRNTQKFGANGNARASPARHRVSEFNESGRVKP